MRFFIIAASVTLALSQVALDVVAHTPPADASASTSGLPSLAVSPAPPAGSPAPSGASLDSEVTPGSSGDASAPPAPAGASTDAGSHGTPHDAQAAPAPPSASSVPATGAAPGNGTISPAGLTPPAPIPGDMSSGKCMCPPPPSCGAGLSPPSPTGINGTTTPTPPPSDGVSDATSQNAPPPGPTPSPAGGANDSQPTSAAVIILGQAGFFTGIVAAAIAAILS